jgi:hypothetical protein
MGSLALAAFGAVGGAGAGITEVAQQAQKEQLLNRQNDLAAARDATHERLRANLELQNQQTLQKSSQEFQHGEKQTEYDVMAKSAGAHAALLKELKQAEIDGRHQDVHDLIAGRISVQDSKNRGSAAAADRKALPQSEYKPGHAYLNSPGVDVFKKPIPGKQVDVQIHHDGSQWIQGPDGLYRFDPSQPNGYADPKTLRRPTAQDTSALLQNPLGTLPSGVSTRDYFVNKFGKLPAEYLGAANTARTQLNGSLPRSAASGVNNTSSNTSEDEQDDRDDSNVALGGDPYGTRGNVPSTSPEDNEPAQ